MDFSSSLIQQNKDFHDSSMDRKDMQRWEVNLHASHFFGVPALAAGMAEVWHDFKIRLRRFKPHESCKHHRAICILETPLLAVKSSLPIENQQYFGWAHLLQLEVRGKVPLPHTYNHSINMIRNLKELYHDQLRDLYSAETQLIAALPTMIDNATNEDLRLAFADHLAETKVQLDRLSKICDDHEIECEGEECEAMKGLIRETNKHIQNTEVGEVRDAVLIASANRVEHYEIAAYGVAKAFAEVLGFDEAADLLDESLEEEAAADLTITRIATGGIFSTGINEAAIN